MRFSALSILLMFGMIYAADFATAPSTQAQANLTRVRMGGPQAHKLIKHEVAPAYPDEAKAKHIHGTVRLHIIIGTTGNVNQIDVVSGPSQLEAAAVEAVRQWQYQPSSYKGRPVEVETVVDLIFKLN